MGDAPFGNTEQASYHDQVDEAQVPVPGAIMVPLDAIERDPAQPRRDWRHDDGYERLAELTRSIQEFGILQPLVVRRAGDHYVVIAGGRRLVAAKRAGLTHVPVIVRDEEGARVRVLQLVENVQRQQLTPLDEARAYQELMEIEGLTVGEIAARIHVSTQTVRDKLRILRDQVLADAVERGQISATAAREISKLPDEGAEQLRRRVQAGERLHVSDIQAVRADMHAAGIVNPRWNPRPSDSRKQGIMGQTPASQASQLAGGVPADCPDDGSRNHRPAAVDATADRSSGGSATILQTATPDTGGMFDLNRAMAEAEDGPSLRDLLAGIPYEQLENVLEYAVARGWSAAGLLHMVRVERTKLR